MANRKGDENLESKIIIRSYPPDTSDQDLRIMFEKYGKIEDCKFNGCAVVFEPRKLLYPCMYVYVLSVQPKG